MILVTMKEAPQGAETGEGRRRGTKIEIEREIGTETMIGVSVGIRIEIGTVIVTTKITETGKEVIGGNAIAAEMMIMNDTVAEIVIGNRQSPFPVIFFLVNNAWIIFLSISLLIYITREIACYL